MRIAVLSLARKPKGEPASRWVPVAIHALVWAVFFAGGTAWARDPVFRAMEVAHAAPASAAPEFSLATPDGKTISLAQLRGQVVFLNFWATWCAPCRLEMPSMEQLHREFKNQGLAVLAVDIRESPKQVARFMKEFRLSFPPLLDTDGEVAARYRVQGMPTTVLIDHGGRIVGVVVGPRQWSSPEAKALIRSFLNRRG
jgi:peroxiredoxin